MADGTHEQFHRPGMSGRIAMRDGSISEPSGLGAAVVQLWHAIRRHRRWFFGCCLAVWLLGVLTLAVLPPVYTATATVAITTQNIDPLAPVSEMQADQFQDDDLPQTIAAAMQSRDVAAAVLAELPAAALQPAATDPTTAQQAAIDDFLKRLNITPEPHSRIIDVDVTAKTAPLAQALANAVVENYQKISLGEQTAQSSHVADWLDSRTQDLQTRWLAAVQAANDYRSANHIADTSDGAATVPLIDQEISNAAASLEAAQAQLIDGQPLHDTGHAETAAEQPEAAATANMLAELETERGQMAGEFGPNYPKVATLDGQIAALRRAPASYGAVTIPSSASNLEAAKARVDRLTARLNQLTQQEAADGLTQANYLTLKAEADNAHTAYSTFVEHAAEVADRASLLQPAISSISPAGLPLRPSFPDKPKLGLGVLLLGLIAGATACRIKDQSFSFAPNFNSGADVPLLAVLPFVPPRPGRIIAHHMLDDPTSRASEAIQGVANALSLLSLRPGPGRCILAASSGAHEGRTTVATWLASTVRQHGEKVLLITADPLSGAWVPGTMAPVKLGWSDIIFGSATAEQVIEADPVTRLDLISAGSIAGHPFEPPELIRIRSALASLRGKYALIVIDTPPLFRAADGLLLSPVADETIFVCRWQHSAPRAVTASIDRLQEKGAHVAGIIVSMVGKNADLAIDGDDGGRELSLVPHLYGA
jgi:polysaccharide biosynthesis transport protein